MAAGRLRHADDARIERYVAPATRGGDELADPEERLRAAEAEARERGFAAGLAEGRANASREADEHLRRLAESIAGIAALRSGVLRGAERDLLELAVRIAEKVVRARIERDEAAVVRAFEAAVAEIPGVDSLTVRCHPDDRDALEAHLAAAGSAHDLRPDPSIGRGGCLVDSAAGEVDVRIETQLRVLEHELLSRS